MMWKFGGAESGDHQLAKRATSGDVEAGEQIVRRYYQSVYQYMLALCRNATLAEDLTQATFTACWQSLPSFEGRAQLRTWIHRIAHRQYVRWLDRTKESENVEKPELSTGFESDIVNSLWIHSAIDQLEPDLREAVVLFYLHEMPCLEIADVLMIPKGTVLSRLHTARKRLRVYLTASYFPDVTTTGPTQNTPKGPQPGGTNYEMSKATS